MKRIIISAFVLCTTILSVCGQDNNKQQTEVKKVLNNIFDGLSALDMPKIKQNCTNDMLVLESGLVWNLDTLANKLSNLNPKMIRVNELKFIRVQVNEKTAWVSYSNTAHFTLNDKKFDINWLESAVLVKQDDKWLVSLLHSTVLK